MAQGDPKERTKVEKQLKKLCHSNKNILQTSVGLKSIHYSYDYNCNAAGLSAEQEKHRQYWEKERDDIMRSMDDIYYFGYFYVYESLLEPLFNVRYTYAFFFLPKTGKTNNIFEGQTVDFGNINKKGKGFIYLDNRYRAKGVWGAYHDRGENHFVFFNDVNWTGEVTSQGLLQGFGEGYCYHKDRIITYFKGNFRNGIPTGDCIFHNFYGASDGKFYNRVTKAQIDWDDAWKNARLQLVLNGEKTDNLALNQSMEIYDVADVLKRFSNWMDSDTGFRLRFSRENKTSLKFAGLSGDNYIADGTLYYHENIASSKASASVDLQILVDKNHKFVGLTNKGKEMLLNYIKETSTSLNTLTKVYNMADISDPVNNLKKKYNIDIQDVKNKIGLITELNKMPDQQSILRSNPKLDKQLKLADNLITTYLFLNEDYEKTVSEKAETFNATDAVRRPVKINGIEWTIHNWVGEPDLVKNKADECTKMVNGFATDPLFPVKRQDVPNKLKMLIASKKKSYESKYPGYYQLAASRIKRELEKDSYIDELIETNKLPELDYSDENFSKSGNLSYAYKFKDGILITIHRGDYYKGNYLFSFFTGHNLESATYTNQTDAICAAYFYKKYDKLRKKGRL